MMIDRRPEHLAFLCVLCVLSGVSVLLSAPVPGSIEAALDPSLRYGWAVSLLVGGGGVLITMIGKITEAALKRQRLVLVPLSLGVIVYAAAAIEAVGWAGVFPAGISVAFAAANAVRGWKITRWVRVAHEVSHG